VRSLGLGLLVLLAACDHDGSYESRSDGYFDSNGGWLTSDDGAARLEIPPGAIAGKVRLFLHARQLAGIGLAGDRAFELVILGGELVRPLVLWMPCADAVCRGDERLGRVGVAGVSPSFEGTELDVDVLRARLTGPALVGVTSCAHLYCLAAHAVGGDLELSFRVRPGQQATVTRIAGDRVHISGPDGDDELVAVLDPLAPPAGLRALDSPTGGVRLVWEPPVLDGTRWTVERWFCGNIQSRLRRAGAGMWDDDVSPGSWYTYEVHAEGGPSAFAQIRPPPPEGGCAVVPFACELVVPAGGDAMMQLDVEPPLARGRYTLGFEGGHEALRGVAREAGFGPGTTPHESTLAVEAGDVGGVERLIWVVATHPESGTRCRGPVWVRISRARDP
jgi:hypothetical protein